MPLHARRLIRKMRGGAQAHLVEADDGHFYVVKFRNNPQHRRILVNELIASVLMRYLQVATPETAIIWVGERFLENEPEAGIQLGSRRIPAETGRHFASRFPGDPAELAVYDFVPDTLLENVVNRRDFLAALIFDKWLSNADSRQSIFFRARVKDWVPSSMAHPLRLGFLALMLDHGYVFGGPHWRFDDAPLQGLYHRPSVYADARSWEDFQPWLDRILHFPELVLDEALRQVPSEWLEDDAAEVERLLMKLLARRKRVPDLIRACARARPELFPHWTDK